MVKKKQEVEVVFTPEDEEEITLDAGYAIARAAPLMDILESWSREQEDFDSMYQVAELWVRIGEALAPTHEHDHGDDPFHSSGEYFGFQTETEILGE